MLFDLEGVVVEQLVEVRRCRARYSGKGVNDWDLQKVSRF